MAALERRGLEKTGVFVGALLGAGLGLCVLAWWLSPSRELPGMEHLSSTRPLAPAAPDSSPRVQAAESVRGRPPEPRTPRLAPSVFPALTSVYDWPREPEAPHELDDKRFAEALALLCGPHADRQVRSWYAPFLLRAAREFAVDAFLLGALVFRVSGCRQAEGQRRVGLAGLDPSLYGEDVRGGRYGYRAFAGGQWSARELSLARFPFEPEFLESPESNLYFAAAFLKGWEEQAPGLRAAFAHRSEYRHFVSHYFWGHQVQSHREEDAVLVERRRLLEYYGAIAPRPPVAWRGFRLGCPLDGCPRVVTSTLGDSRANGARLHAGNDFESTAGEPVRAIADGTVVFAGVDLPGRGAASKVPIWAQRNVDPSEMGAGGLYVCLDHGASSEGTQLVSCYMHLEAATVVQGRLVARGEQVGRVGTTGIKESRPHLHFELHSQEGAHRAADVLTAIALGNPQPRPPQVSAATP